MNGNRALLDSNVIIYASKGIISIQDIVSEYDFLFTSIISYIETLGYNFEKKEEKESVNYILDNVEIVNLNKEIADIAIEYRKKKKIKLPDSVVIASAKNLKADLLTSDISDFHNIDLSVRLIEPIRRK